MTKQQAIAVLRARGEGQLADMIRGMSLTPGSRASISGISASCLGFAALVYLLRSRAQLGPGLCDGRSRPAHRLPHARGRGVQARPPPAALFRPALARRHLEPGHQRHRQRHHDAAARHEPAAPLDPHDPRGDRDDVLDQPVTCGRFAHNSAAVDCRDICYRPPLPGAVQGPVGAHWGAQRPRRRDAHRARPRSDIRSQRHRGGRVRCRERAALRSELPSPVPLRGDPAGDAVPRQLELRGDRRRRGLPRRLGGALAWRRAGLHPVLTPVHDADHPDRQPDEPPAVGGRLGRAGLRPARR